MPAGRMDRVDRPEGGARDAAGREIVRAERRPYVRKCLMLLALLVVLSVLSLPIGASQKMLFGVDEVLGAIALWVTATLDSVVSGVQHSSMELLELCPAYYQVLSRIAITAIAIACGAMTSLSGALYQMVFRNPIAAPTMLGVGNGITLGVVVLVILFGASAPYMVGYRYLFCYLGALIVLALVVGLAVLIGKGRLVVVDMLLVGTIVSALVGQAVVFFTYSIFDEDTWAIFNAINEMLDVNTSPLSLVVLAAAFVLSVGPIVALRFKLNLVAFDEADMRLSGTNPTALRFIALTCATVMIISAQVQIGTIAMVALIAPYAARSFFGAEFTKQVWGAALIGALLVLVCEDVASLIGIALLSQGYLLDFPIGLAANIVCLPLFAWIIASQSRVWE